MPKTPKLSKLYVESVRSSISTTYAFTPDDDCRPSLTIDVMLDKRDNTTTFSVTALRINPVAERPDLAVYFYKSFELRSKDDLARLRAPFLCADWNKCAAKLEALIYTDPEDALWPGVIASCSKPDVYTPRLRALIRESLTYLYEYVKKNDELPDWTITHGFWRHDLNKD